MDGDGTHVLLPGGTEIDAAAAVMREKAARQVVSIGVQLGDEDVVHARRRAERSSTEVDVCLIAPYQHDVAQRIQSQSPERIVGHVTEAAAPHHGTTGVELRHEHVAIAFRYQRLTIAEVERAGKRSTDDDASIGRHRHAGHLCRVASRRQAPHQLAARDAVAVFVASRCAILDHGQLLVLAIAPGSVRLASLLARMAHPDVFARGLAVVAVARVAGCALCIPSTATATATTTAHTDVGATIVTCTSRGKRAAREKESRKAQ